MAAQNVDQRSPGLDETDGTPISAESVLGGTQFRLAGHYFEGRATARTWTRRSILGYPGRQESTGVSLTRARPQTARTLAGYRVQVDP
jgi:hypothetical protein